MKIKRVKEGLLIPEEYLRKLGEEVEVIFKPFEIIIRPKSVDQKTNPETHADEMEGKQSHSPKSSARALLKHAGGWKGEDLEDLLEEVYVYRGKF